MPDAPAGGRRAGERHERDVGVGDDGLTDVRAADDDLQQAIRQPGLGEDGSEHGAPDDGRLRIGLEDHGVAQREGRRDDAHAEHGR